MTKSRLGSAPEPRSALRLNVTNFFPIPHAEPDIFLAAACGLREKAAAAGRGRRRTTA